ncbi:MAG: OmpH family outer membrane protein [Acidobacteria bacterium]|nr:OmpH family outer membrane protein [Acidobacteriota bacterium]MCA1639331.1 OmpH family outer membrane protein [Acidobacteriota bacterium]
MKTFRLIAASLFFAALFSTSSFAQTGATAAGTGKIVIINTAAFDDKAGISKYVSAMNTLETEFKPVDAELQKMNTDLQTLAKDIDAFRRQVADRKVPIDEKSANLKVEQAEKLQRDLKFKQEDAKARFERRQQALLSPVLQDIAKAMQDFAKSRGYSMILDAAKLDQAGIILAVGDDKADVTKEFITFYNARPATTASIAKP